MFAFHYTYEKNSTIESYFSMLTMSFSDDENSTL